MRKRIVLLIALLVVSCLICVGCAPVGTTSVESSEEESESGELNDFFDDQEEYYDADLESYEPETYSEPSEIPGKYLDLDGMTIVAMAPFEGGIGWIQYMDGGEMYTAAVELDGHVLFEIPGPVWYVSAFEDGAAYAVVSDNATYYPNASPIVGCYEQVAPAVFHEEIYDLSGQLLYSTDPTYDAATLGENHIVCAGNASYVVLRHVADLEYDSWQLGVINKNGEILYDFAEYDEVDKGLLRTWRGKYSGTGRLPNMYGADYGNSNAGDQGDGFSRYIGEGVYYLTSGSSEVLYKPAMNIAVESSGKKLLSECYGGKVLSTWNGSYYIQDIINDSFEHAVPLQSNLNYEDIGPGRTFRYGHFMTEGLYYHDHAYYDIEMNRAIEIEQYTSLKMDGSIFNDGFALIFLVGKDGNTYVTVINDEGTIQFEPFRADLTSGRISDGYFVARTDTECTVYDVMGNYVRHLCNATEAGYICDISGGYVTIFGDGRNRIYDMNPEQDH